MVRSRWRWVRRRGGGSEAHLIRNSLRRGPQSGFPCGSLLEVQKEKEGNIAFARRLLAGCGAIILATTAWADDHAEPKALPKALWPNSEIPAGAKPVDWQPH